jgi:hypothetical protein
MSAQAEVAEGLEKPMDTNAQSAEDAKKLLAELEGEAAASSESKPEVVNGTTKDTEAADKENNHSPERRRDYHDRDRESFRGRGRGRGGGRGRGRGDRRDNFDGPRRSYHNDNIKSDLTTQEVSDDPEAIRKQVA